jgi:tetratricopeptide (TPR) repeat protein
MGIALKNQGKLEEAIKAYNKAITIKPDYALAAINFVKLPIGSIDEETILGLNKQFSILSSNIQNQSQRLFYEANLFTHKGEYEEAFKRFVEANHIKSNEISSVVKNLTQNYYKIVNRIERWSPHIQKHTEYSLKKLFLLGPSRSGKSSLEKLLMRIPKIYPMYENISLNTLQESEVGSREVKSFDMAELFYHDEHRLLDDRYSFVTSTSPESMFHIDRLLDGLVNSFCVLVKRDRADVASEIFTQEYRNGNFFSYNHSSIQDYLNTYSVIWKEIKRKAPQRTLEIEYEDILMKPKEVLGQINDFTGEHLVLDDAEQYSAKNRISPFREHYAQKFRS